MGTDKEPNSNNEMKDKADCKFKAWKDFAMDGRISLRCPHCGGKLM